MSLWKERAAWFGFGALVGIFVGIGVTLIGPG